MQKEGGRAQKARNVKWTTRGHDGNVPPGPFERVIARLSIQSANLHSAGGGEPEFTTADMAAATAGLRDPLASTLVGVMQDEPRPVHEACEVLDARGWEQWRKRRHNDSIRPKQHRQLSRCALEEWRNGPPGFSVRELRRRLGVAHERWSTLMPHYVWMGREILEAEALLVEHLRRKLQRDGSIHGSADS